MPTVPIYRGPQINESALPSARLSANAPAEAFGGGAALNKLQRTTQGVTSDIFELVQKEKKKADDVAVLEADKNLAEYENNLLYGDGGALTRTGKDAFGLPEETFQNYEKKFKDLESNLNNPEQIARFRQIYDNRATAVNRQIQKHVYNETRKYDDAVSNASLVNERNAAAANYLDPFRIDQSIARQKEVIASHAERMGMPPEWVEQKTDEEISKTHAAVIYRFLGNDKDSLGSDYYKKHKKEIAGTDRITLEKALEEGGLRGKSQRFVDKMFQEGLSHTEILDKIKDIDEPKLRDAIATRYKNEYNLRQSAERADQEDLFKEVANQIEVSKSRDNIPLEKWLKLPDASRKAIDARINQLNKGIEPATDWDLYYNLKTMASTPATKEEFLKKNLLLERSRMADSEFKEMINLQTGLRNKDANSETLLNGYRTNASIVNDTLKQLDINPNAKPGTSGASKVNQFRRLVDQEILTLQDRTGKKVTTDEVQGIVDRLATEIITTRNLIWFDSTKNFFELEPGETIDLDLENVPKGERSKIESALKGRGIPATEQNILNLYRRKLESMRNAP